MTELDNEITEDPPELEADAELKFEIINYPADTTLRGYLDQWRSGQIVVPHFQREYVWDVKRASKLIESFLLGLPVPTVFLYKTRNNPSYLIIDGQQRITSVVRFLQEDFEDKKFRLRAVAPCYEGKSFSDLDDKTRFQLENTVLRAIIIQQLSPDDDTSIYRIFERLNTGGINLNPMEVRQSISYPPLIEALKKSNDLEAWRRLIGTSRADKRLKDVELILRVWALRGNHTEYEKPMKGYLTNFAERARARDNQIAEYSAWFDETVSFVYESLGDRPFNYRGRINYGVLDSVLATRPSGAKPSDLRVRYEALKKDISFDDYVTSDTSDTMVVRKRLALAERMLWGS